MSQFEIHRHLVYSMQSGANARTIKRYHHQLLNVEEQARARLGRVWPEFLECGARRTGECFCGANRDVKLWMRIHGSLVLVELDAEEHMRCTRGREAARYGPMARAFGGRVVVLRLRWSGRGAPLAARLEELAARVGAAAAAAAAAAAQVGAAAAAAVEVAHVHFARGEPDFGAEAWAAGAGAGAAGDAASADAASEDAASEDAASEDEAVCATSVRPTCGRAGAKRQRSARCGVTFGFEENLEYFKKKGRQGRGFWNPEKRRLTYEESGDRARLLEEEAWVLFEACKVAPELRQAESRFTGFCGCGALRYVNVWMETDEPTKTLFLVEMDAHEHLRCTRGRERGRYTGLMRHFGGPVFVLRWNAWRGAAREGDGAAREGDGAAREGYAAAREGDAGAGDRAADAAARAGELMAAVTGSLNRIDDGDNVGEGNCHLEVLHVGYGGEAPNFPAGLRLGEAYAGGYAEAGAGAVAVAGAPAGAWAPAAVCAAPAAPPPGARFVYTGW